MNRGGHTQPSKGGGEGSTSGRPLPDKLREAVGVGPVVFRTAEAEDSGQGLGRFLAEIRVGAEGEPGSGHALEPAQRPVGHPREDLDDEVLREAGHALLLPRPPRHPISVAKLQTGWPP